MADKDIVKVSDVTVVLLGPADNITVISVSVVGSGSGVVPDVVLLGVTIVEGVDVGSIVVPVRQ